MSKQRESGYLHIKEFAETMGIESYNLRFYEKSGLFQIQRDQNGYRIYTENNGYELSQFLALLSIGLTVPEAVERLKCDDLHATLSMMEGLDGRLHEEAFLLQCKQKKLREAKQFLLDLSQDPEGVQEVQIDPFYAVQLTQDEKWDGTALKALGMAGWNRIAPAYYHGAIGNKEQTELYYLMPKEANDALNLGLENYMPCISWGNCVRWMSSTEVFDASQYPHVMRYLKEHRLRPSSDKIVAFYLMMQVSGISPGAAMMMLPVKKITS